MLLLRLQFQVRFTRNMTAASRRTAAILFTPISQVVRTAASGFSLVMTPSRRSQRPNGRPFLMRPVLRGFCGFNHSRLKLGRSRIWEFSIYMVLAKYCAHASVCVIMGKLVFNSYRHLFCSDFRLCKSSSQSNLLHMKSHASEFGSLDQVFCFGVLEKYLYQPSAGMKK